MSILGTTDFGHAGCVVTVDHDPAAVSTDVAKGCIIIDAAGVHWCKLDDGDTTNVARMSRNKQISVSADTDALDVTDANTIAVDTSGGNVTIGGLANGVAGQVVHLIKQATANNLIIEHNEGAGTQKIFTPDALDMTLATFGGVTLVFFSSTWYVVSE